MLTRLEQVLLNPPWHPLLLLLLTSDPVSNVCVVCVLSVLSNMGTYSFSASRCAWAVRGGELLLGGSGRLHHRGRFTRTACSARTTQCTTYLVHRKIPLLSQIHVTNAVRSRIACFAPWLLLFGPALSLSLWNHPDASHQASPSFVRLRRIRMLR